MLDKLVGPDICELLATNQLDKVREVLDTWLPADLAGIVLNVPRAEQPRLISALDPNVAAATFAYLHEVAQQRLLDELPDSISARILNRMAPDDRTALLQDVPPEMRHRLLALLTP